MPHTTAPDMKMPPPRVRSSSGGVRPEPWKNEDTTTMPRTTHTANRAMYRPGTRVVVTGPAHTGLTGSVETTSPGTVRVRFGSRERCAVFRLHELAPLSPAVDDGPALADGGAR